MDEKIPTPQDVQKFFEDYFLNMERVVKDLFKPEIQPGFLATIRRYVLLAIIPELANLYDLRITKEKALIGDTNNIEYEISRAIIGAHHANTVFLTNEEISAKQKNTDYQKHLFKQAGEMICLRPYAAVYFRKKPLNNGERYLYYPVPYLLFVISMRINELLLQTQKRSDALFLSSLIMNKALAALTLLEDQFLDSAYMPCRTVIEMFVKLLLFKKHPYLFQESQKYVLFDVNKTCCSQEYSEEFKNAYAARKVKKATKTDYIHYGFLDKLEGYDTIVKEAPYSIKGIIRYLSIDADDETKSALEHLARLHTMCHGYAHGNVITTKYPTLHYFEISLILGEIIPRVYSIVCEECDVSTKMQDYDVLERFNEEFSLLKEQRHQQNTANYDLELKKENKRKNRII